MKFNSPMVNKTQKADIFLRRQNFTIDNVAQKKSPQITVMSQNCIKMQQQKM